MGLFSRRSRDVELPSMETLLAAQPIPMRAAPRGITAAATLIDLADPTVAARAAARHRKRPFQWQKDAWYYHDELEPVRGYARWTGDTQSRMRLYPAIIVDPQQPPVPADQVTGISPNDVAVALEALSRVRSMDDDLGELQRVFGVNLAMTGEVYLVGTETPDAASADNPMGEQWRACSVEEVVVTRDGRWAISGGPETRESEWEYLDPETTILVRMYRRHGRYREWPDGPMRPGNLICEELLVATQSMLATLNSRIGAGILPIPNDLVSTKQSEDHDDEDGEDSDDVDQVLDELLKHLATAVKNPKAASRLVPYLLSIDPLYLDKIKLVDIGRDIDVNLVTRIDQLLRRFASCVDMPDAEAMGKGDLNHWNVYELDEDGVRNHIEPLTSIYSNAITTRLWRPRLEMAGVTDVQRWVLAADPSEVMHHPDMSAAALNGYNATPPLVSRVATAKAIGFTEDEMPDETEVAEIMEARVSTTMRLSGDAPANALPEDQKQVGKPPPPAGVQASSAPPNPLAGLGARWARAEAQLQRDILIEASLTLQRMVEKAQNRIRNAAQRRPETRALAAMPVEVLVPMMGREGVESQLSINDDDLFAGGLDTLLASLAVKTGHARAQALADLRRHGIDPAQDALDRWDESAAEHMEHAQIALTTALLAAASALLYSGHSSPDTDARGEQDRTLAVRPSEVRGAINAAGGGPTDGAPDTASGVLSGNDFLTLLRDTPGIEPTGWAWEVGAPTNPFEPHQELEGAEFDSWTDDQLAAPADEYPYVSFYAPQDHDGCQCTVAPTVEAVEVEVPDEEAA